MKTIDQIITDNWFIRNELIVCKQSGICNWCWWKWGFNFTKALNKIPYFNSNKKQELLFDLSLICNMHDLQYNKWWTFLDFINYNYILANNVMRLFHWTNSIARMILFVLIFWWTTLFWYKYFNKK